MRLGYCATKGTKAWHNHLSLFKRQLSVVNRCRPLEFRMTCVANYFVSSMSSVLCWRRWGLLVLRTICVADYWGLISIEHHWYRGLLITRTTTVASCGLLVLLTIDIDCWYRGLLVFTDYWSCDGLVILSVDN